MNAPEAKHSPRKSAKSLGLPASGRRYTTPEVKASISHHPLHYWHSPAKHPKGFAGLVSANLELNFEVLAQPDESGHRILMYTADQDSPASAGLRLLSTAPEPARTPSEMLHLSP